MMSNCKVIDLVLQLKSAKAHGKNYVKVKPHLVSHFLRNHLFDLPCFLKKDLRQITEFLHLMEKTHFSQYEIGLVHQKLSTFKRRVPFCQILFSSE